MPLHTNYGGILQAYALQTVLSRMGHNACVIEKEQRPLHLPVWRKPVKYARRIIRNLRGEPYPIFYEQKQNRELPIIRQHTDKFIRKNIRRMTFSAYSAIIESDFDAIVVGSDQVWRPQYFDDIRTAYLDFAEGWRIRRMAYALRSEQTHGNTHEARRRSADGCCACSTRCRSGRRRAWNCAANTSV